MNSSLCPKCDKKNEIKSGIKLSLNEEYRITCIHCGCIYADTVKGKALIYSKTIVFDIINYFLIICLIGVLFTKIFFFEIKYEASIYLIIIATFCVNLAFKGIITGELSSKGLPIYKDLNPTFFNFGVIVYLILSFLSLLSAINIFLK